MNFTTPPQPVRKVEVSKYNRPPVMLWKVWTWMMRYFLDRLPRVAARLDQISQLMIINYVGKRFLEPPSGSFLYPLLQLRLLTISFLR